MTTLQTITISFPEVSLHVRDAHKLRGYFGNLFREYSPLLHNHYDTGQVRYAYPLVQYKVINKVPTLIGFADGAGLLTSLFLKIKELDIDGRKYLLNQKNIEAKNHNIGLSNELYEYQFQTLWMALNQENYNLYKDYAETDRQKQLQAILIRNIQAFYKAFGIYLQPEQRIMARLRVEEKQTQFKNQPMLAFKGSFTTNALLPCGAGLGKSVSRGFGAIKQVV